MNYWLPLKCDLPSFQYDLAIYCECLLEIVGNNFPPYLKDFENKLKEYAAQKNTVRPDSFDELLRIYIFDHRLGIPLILLDSTGKIANWCYWFVKGNFRLEQYIYGDGENFGPQLLNGKWDNSFIKEFIRLYGFAPIEELGCASLCIFREDELRQRCCIAPWQVSFLLEKYRSKNIVNWREILLDTRYR